MRELPKLPWATTNLLAPLFGVHVDALTRGGAGFSRHLKRFITT